MFNGKKEPEENPMIKAIKETANFDIFPCPSSIQLSDSSQYKKLELSSVQKAQMDSLIQIFVQGTATGIMANSYIAKFPAGLPHTLMCLKQGGFASKIVDVNNHNSILGDASFYSITSSAALLGVFNTMSAVTGQYFLAEINQQMHIVNMKLDEILDFLYGDKKAELLAEISFVQFAYENMPYIIGHNEQRISVLTNLQNARKVAEKDIEFYLEDLQTTSQKEAKDINEFRSIVNHALTIKKSIEYACQLFEISVLMEIYYAENYEKEFIDFIENNLISYTNRVGGHIISTFSTLQGRVKALNTFQLFGKIEDQGKDKNAIINTIEEAIAPYKNEKDSQIRTSFRQMIECLQQTELYYDSNGHLYVKRKPGE